MSITEKQICEEYRVLKFWRRGLSSALDAARLRRSGTDEQRKAVWDLLSKVYEIEKEIDRLYREPIGAAVQSRIESNL